MTTIENKQNGFNETVSELKKNLSLCFQAPDGKIYWYEGTIELAFKLLSYLIEDKKEYTDEKSLGSYRN